MLGLLKVAVTGGLSCGKTTVCQFLKELGAYVVSSDAIVHQLLSPDTKLGKKVVSLLGTLDRRKIAEIVFQDHDLLKKLEHLLHPVVQEEIDKEYALAKSKGAPLFVAEVPLLFEAGLEKHYDVIIAVSANNEDSKARFIKKTRDDEEAFLRRASLQWNVKDKVARANYVIQNNGSLESLGFEVENLFNQLISRKER